MAVALYTRSYGARYDEADLYNRPGPSWLINCCQDAASRHIRRLGVSIADLKGLGLIWVLSRYRLLVDSYPSPGTSIAITTWPSTREDIFTCREFEVRSEGGELLARATSSWAAMDASSRRPVPLDRLPPYPLHPERAVADLFATIPRLGKAEREMSLPVMRRDLDQNGHVNNTVYLDWAMEAVDDVLYASSRPVDLALNFRSEAMAGEVIGSRVSRIQRDGGTETLHQIVAAAGRELARLQLFWPSP
jgi:acyl-ACP thioesterase